LQQKLLTLTTEIIVMHSIELLPKKEN